MKISTAYLLLIFAALTFQSLAGEPTLGKSPSDYRSWLKNQEGWKELACESNKDARVLVFRKMREGGTELDQFGRFIETPEELIAERKVFLQKEKGVLEIWTINQALDVDEGLLKLSEKLHLSTQEMLNSPHPITEQCDELLSSNATNWTKVKFSVDPAKQSGTRGGWISMNPGAHGRIVTVCKGMSQAGKTCYYVLEVLGLTGFRYSVGELPLMQELTGLVPSSEEAGAAAETKAKARSQ